MAHSISDKNMQFTYLDMEILICCLWIRQCVVLQSETNSIFDVTTYVRQLFHSVMSAKKCDIWEEKERLSKENPEEYHVTPISIASDDFGEPFICGDCFSGKFNMEIIGVRVI